MSRTPDTVVIMSRKNDASPRPSVYAGLSVLTCVLTPARGGKIIEHDRRARPVGRRPAASEKRTNNGLFQRFQIFFMRSIPERLMSLIGHLPS